MKNDVLRSLERKTYPIPMKSQHLTGFDLEVEDTECVVLRQFFHTQRLRNLDFIGVLVGSREKKSFLSTIGPPTALRPRALPASLRRAEYVNDR